MSTGSGMESTPPTYSNDERPKGIEFKGDAPTIDVEKSDIFDTVLHLLKVFPEQWESCDSGFEHKPTGIKLRYTFTILILEGVAAGTVKFRRGQKRAIKKAINSILAASWHKAAIKSSLGKKTNHESARVFPTNNMLGSSGGSSGGLFGGSIAGAMSPLQQAASADMVNNIDRTILAHSQGAVKFGSKYGVIDTAT